MRTAGLKQRDEANTVATLGKVRGRCIRTSRWNEDVEALDRETDCAVVGDALGKVYV